MNNQEPGQTFSRQARKFGELLDIENSHHGQPLGRTIAAPSAVLAFAESLLVCSTEESVLSHIRKDLEAARVFRIILDDIASEVERGKASIAIPMGQSETPFRLVASIVRLRALSTIDRHGDSWPPGFSGR
jgi:hypothetical protein